MIADNTKSNTNTVVWLRRDDYEQGIVEMPDDTAMIVAHGQPIISFTMTPSRRAGLALHYKKVVLEPEDLRTWGVVCFRSSYGVFGPGFAALTDGPGGPWIEFDSEEEAAAAAARLQASDDTPDGWAYKAIELRQEGR